MNSLIKRIELVANLAIIAVAILVAMVLVRSYLLPRFRPPQQTVRSAIGIGPGTQLSLPGIDWKGNGGTLLLALSTQCHFCTESGPFYKRIVDERVRNPKLRLVAIFPQSVPEAQKYLRDLGVNVDDVRQSQLESLGVDGTPTLIIGNNEGIVADFWRGKLTSDKEAEVLSRLK